MRPGVGVGGPGCMGGGRRRRRGEGKLEEVMSEQVGSKSEGKVQADEMI